MKKIDPKSTHESTEDGAAESRRRFLKKAGKLAIYTPPAMALMMQPSQASFLKSGAIVDWRERLQKREDQYPEWQSLWDRIRQWFSSYSDD